MYNGPIGTLIFLEIKRDGNLAPIGTICLFFLCYRHYVASGTHIFAGCLWSLKNRLSQKGSLFLFCFVSIGPWCLGSNISIAGMRNGPIGTLIFVEKKRDGNLVPIGTICLFFLCYRHYVPNGTYIFVGCLWSLKHRLSQKGSLFLFVLICWIGRWCSV